VSREGLSISYPVVVDEL